MHGNGEMGWLTGSNGEPSPIPRARLRPARRRVIAEIRYGAKRLLDIGLSAFLLILLAPAFAAIALAIKLDSRGTVVFVQARAGSRRVAQRGRVWWEPRVFPCFKFRSMVASSNDSAHAAHVTRFVNGSIDAAAEETVKMTGDARVTRVGRILRRTSLDELPQLVNVLKGDMSLVGPRPVPLYEVAEYEPWHYERLAARPGITGLWQVHGRGRVSFTEMMRMDIDYVRKPSLAADMKLLALTVPAVLNGKGAH